MRSLHMFSFRTQFLCSVRAINVDDKNDVENRKKRRQGKQNRKQ